MILRAEKSARKHSANLEVLNGRILAIHQGKLWLTSLGKMANCSHAFRHIEARPLGNRSKGIGLRHAPRTAGL